MKYGEIVPVAWSTKYALTKGITEIHDLRVTFPGFVGAMPREGDEAPEEMTVYLSSGGPGNNPSSTFQRLGKDIFLTRPEAVARAEKLRKKAVSLAERKVERLKAIVF